MSKSDEYRPRLSVMIREDQQVALHKLVPRGLLRPLIEAIVDDVIEMMKEHGTLAIAAILKGVIPSTALVERDIKEIKDGLNR